MKDFVVGMGEVLWDVLPGGKKIGGAPANFAYHISQFGLAGCVISAVGKDDSGKEIMDCLAAKRVNQHIAEVAYPTGTVLVEVDRAGVPRYEIRENVAWDNIPYTQHLEDIAKETKAVCFGSLAQRSAVSRDTINRFLDAMPHDGEQLIVFDVNLRQKYYDKKVLQDSMKRCNVLKINDEELDEIGRIFGYPMSDFKDICRKIINGFDLKILILTCGIDGSYVFTADGESFLPTPKVTVADTVGAGDSFTAAFIASVIRGKSISEAHSVAVRTSAFVCTKAGAMPILPDELTK